MGSWKVILPEYGKNYLKSPVAMGVASASSDYDLVGIGTTVTQSTDHSYLGYKCYAVAASADNTGAKFYTETLGNYIHYVSMRTYGTVSAWDWSLDGTNFYAPTLLATEGDWSVYGYTFLAAQANASTALYVYKNAVSDTTWYIGHIQVESAQYATTYTTPITGDIKGFMDGGYKWLGAAHSSASQRLSQERSGGKEVDLETTYNFKVMYGVGTGMPPIQHHVQGMALLPGALYQGHKVLPRVLDLVSTTKGNTATVVTTARKNFINAVKPDRVVPEQPVVFRYYGVNANKPVEFYSYYDSGLEFQLTSGVVDKPTARFICYDPFCYETHTESKQLKRYSTVADADYVVRKEDGVWYNISTDFNNQVFAIARTKAGNIYIGGQFTNVGDADGDYIMRWNPFTSTLSKLSAANILSGQVNGLLAHSNGGLYLCGNFTNLVDANGDYISLWNGTAYTSLSTGLTDIALCMVSGIDGSVYVGGHFTNVTDANGDYITKWNGTAFSSLGTGMQAGGGTGYVNALACAPNGDIYATGDFVTAGGVTSTAYIAKWNGTAWLPLGTGLDGIGRALAIDQSGSVYVGGDFHNANGVACAHIAKWNGKTFEPLGEGMNAEVWCLTFNKYGQLYAGGLFTSAGGIDLADRMAVWNGTSWHHLDINLPGTPYVYSILPVDDDLYIGYSTSGSAIASYRNMVAVANTGSHTIYPVIKVFRDNDGTSATLKYIRNETTRQTILCDYDLQAGETLTIDLTPGDRSVTSDAPTNPRGGSVDVWRAVLRGSDLAEFGLIGGTNYISVYVAEVGTPTVSCWLEYKTTHWAADTAA